MAVVGLYIAERIRRDVRPFIRVYGQWVEEYVLPLAASLSPKAEAFQQQVYEELGSQPCCDEAYPDMADIAEQAFDGGLTFYEQLTAMYQAALNLYTAGLFHVVEQQLGDLTRDGAIVKEISDTKLDIAVKWYRKNFAVDLEAFPRWPLITELQLLANAIKHAQGPAEKKLRQVRPTLLDLGWEKLPAINRPRPSLGCGLLF